MRLVLTLTAGRQLSRCLFRSPAQKLLPLSCVRHYKTATWDYETERKHFQLKAPEYYNFARDVVDRWAQKEQTGEGTGSPALWWLDETGEEEKTFSFLEISSVSKRVANILTGPCQLHAGDIAIVILPRIPEWWAVNVAAIRSGIVLSPGTTLLRAHDIEHRLKVSGAKTLITNQACADIVDQVADGCPTLKTKMVVGGTRSGWLSYDNLLKDSSDSFECVNSRASDAMTLFFTSGTTGAPKMAEHTHSSYGLGHLITARYFLDLCPGDVFWNLSDTGWAKCAWSSLFSPWLGGACVFVQDSSKFDAKLTIQNPELLKEWKDVTGKPLYEGYGQTETTFLCGTYPCIKQKPGSMGKAAPGIDLKIVDDDGMVVARGKEGNIAVKCKPDRPVGLFARYVDDDEKMKSVFKGDYYLTGDRGMMDDEDYIWFLSRSDDVILSSGYRIGPFEVESALLEHPAVLESAVVSSPDRDRGEIVKAFVILTEEYKSRDGEALVKELQEHAKQVTAPYKYPRKIEFVDTLPKTVSGKIRRIDLRNREWGRD